VLEVAVASVERQSESALEKLGESGDTFGQEGSRQIGLLEVLVRRIDKKWNAARRPVPEQADEGVEALLGVGERHLRQRLLLGIVVNVHPFPREDVPIEVSVLDLVLAEGDVLRR
jgi:hypothetical protein